ncbi:MAG: hypothetical protein EKK42_22280 [Pseudonocardiaceae bacterium]|nr:MAG: hypothetical protein EKK42_22280 [Pseudonocardiaceae bacterium]
MTSHRVDRLVQRVTTLMGDRLVVRVMRRMTAISGYDRALALASQAFVALVPAILVISEGLGGSGRLTELASSLGFSPSAADTVGGLVDRPSADHSLTALGWVLLVVSVLGFVRSLQRAYSAAWNLPSTGIRGYARSILVSAALVLELAVLVLLAPLLGWLVGSPVVSLAAYAVTALILWWPIQFLLLRGRVGWRALLPGAAVTGAGQALLVTASGFIVPVTASRAAERLGLLGVATVVLSWLVVLGVLLVVSAVLGAELAQTPGTADDPEETDDPA